MKGQNKTLKTLSKFAHSVTALNVNTTCLLLANQPELPKDANKLRKF